MSYNILYRSMFLKVKDNMYIPICERGDNNVQEVYYNKRRNKMTREWCNSYFEGMNDIYCTKEEFLNSLEIKYDSFKSMDKKYSDKDFGFAKAISIYGKTTCNTTWNDFVNFFKRGFKNAITFEEAKNLNITIYVTYYDLINNKNNTSFVNSEEELFNRINEIKSEGKHTVWVGYLDVSERIYNLVRSLKSNKKGDCKIKTNFGFVKSFVNFKPVFTNNEEEAHKFPSNKQLDPISDLILCDENPRCTYIRD